jgi:hypothetical protein
MKNGLLYIRKNKPNNFVTYCIPLYKYEITTHTLIQRAEYRGRVKILASYSGRLGLKPLTGDRMYPDRGFSCFSSVPPDIPGYYIALGHDRFFYIRFNSSFTYHTRIDAV